MIYIAQPKHTILAVDVGYGNTKAAWNVQANPANRLVWSEIGFRSVTPVASSADAQDVLRGLNRVVVSVNGEHFFVGPEATIEGGTRSRKADFTTSPEHEALLCGAWHYMWQETGQVSDSVDLLVLGLPVSGFRAKRDQLTALGKQTHRVPVPHVYGNGNRKGNGNGPQDGWLDVTAKEVIVLPQPMGGLRQVMENEKGFDLMGDDQINVILDVGYHTLDWFVAFGSKPQFELSGSFAGGFSQILEKINNQIALDHGAGLPGLGMVEQAFYKETMRFESLRISMEPYKALAKKTAAEVVARLLDQSNLKNINSAQFFVCGGGASAYLEAFKAQMPGEKMGVMDNSVMANARGYYLTGMDYLEG